MLDRRCVVFPIELSGWTTQQKVKLDYNMSEALHQLLISQWMSRPGTLPGITVECRYLTAKCVPAPALSPAGAVSMSHVKLITTVPTADCINQLNTYIINNDVARTYLFCIGTTKDADVNFTWPKFVRCRSRGRGRAVSWMNVNHGAQRRGNISTSAHQLSQQYHTSS